MLIKVADSKPNKHESPVLQFGVPACCCGMYCVNVKVTTSPEASVVPSMPFDSRACH